MKKIFAILMLICMLASALFVTAFAADEPAAGVVLRVSALENDSGDNVVIKDYTDFEEGWEAAIDLALDKEAMEKYNRVVVDFYADWKADDDGEFGNSWDGFSHYTIRVPDDVKITLNLGGHTIDRHLEESESDGEVIYIDEDADVIINDGTIKGGKSDNGAGGIHVHGADLTLNNVHITGNVADNDDGGGIALYDGATLVMNGGSFKDNVLDGFGAALCYGGAVHIVEGSNASFHGVEFKNNQAVNREALGTAIYVEEGSVYLSECSFDGNGVEDEDNKIYAGVSVIHGINSTIKIEKTTFTNNGSIYADPDFVWNGYEGEGVQSSIIHAENSTLTIKKQSVFTNNSPCALIYCLDGSEICVSYSTFKDNKAAVICSYGHHTNDSYFRNCSFNNNKMPYVYESYYLEHSFAVSGTSIWVSDCDLGDSTFKNTHFIGFFNTSAPDGVGSIFGEGSLTMIVAIVALIVSVASILVNVSSKKNKNSSSEKTAEDRK
jgi:hypothetical protein